MTRQVIDRAVLDDLFEHIGADGARSVLAIFVEEARGYLAAIAEASVECDAAVRDRARRAAHALKSGAAQIGAAAMAEAAAAVERAAAVEGPALRTATAALDACTAPTFAALDALLRCES